MKNKIVVSIAFIVASLLAWALIGGGIMNLFDDTYVSKVIIDKPYDVVWQWISNPETYARIYPNWVKAVKKNSDTVYHVEDQFGKAYDIEVVRNKKNGVVDLKIGSETSQMRLLPVEENRTAAIHFAKRWDGVNFVGWFFHKRTIDKDMKRAKRIIEEQ